MPEKTVEEQARVWLCQPERQARHPALLVTGWGMGALRAERTGPHIRKVWGHRRTFVYV